MSFPLVKDRDSLGKHLFLAKAARSGALGQPIPEKKLVLLRFSMAAHLFASGRRKLRWWACGVMAAQDPVEVSGEGSNPSRSIPCFLEGLSLRDMWRIRRTGCDPPTSNLISAGIVLIIIMTLTGYRLSVLANGLGISEAVCTFGKWRS